MRVPLSWLRELVALPGGTSDQELADRLTMLALKQEALEPVGVSGPLVVGRVMERTPETHKNGKSINWCRVDVGAEHNAAEGNRGIVCGAHNFDVDDLVVVALPGAVLPGDFAIAARKTYGHVSDGMICSARELDLGDDAMGIIVLSPGEADAGDDAAALLQVNDSVLELEVTTDRGYALSMRGVARDTALAYGLDFDDPAGLPTDVGDGESYPVHVEDAAGCPLFVARTVTGFDPSAPTPRWMARRLQLAGMRPISLAVDVTNYVMLELGQPIHGYDRDRLQGPIAVRRARGAEQVRTLDGVERTMDGSELLITDDSGPIGMAGVMGGEPTEISAATTSVVIEAAHFDSVTVGRTARRHKLISEASRRFDRGVDPRLPRAAASRVARLLAELGGATVEPGVTVVGEPPARPVIELDHHLVREVSGIDVAREEVSGALQAVGCEGDLESKPLQVMPPSWRPDLTDPYDLVEEVARVVGYDKIPSVLPVAPPGSGLTQAQRLRRRVGHALAGAGFTEVYAYPFIGTDDLDALGLPVDDERRCTVQVANPLSEREPLLHTTLASALLKVLARNTGRGSSDLALCLMAPVFLRGSQPLPPAPLLPVDRAPTSDERAALDAALPAQPRHVAVALAGNREPAGWWGPARGAVWADAVATARRVAGVLHLELDVTPAQREPWHPGRCGQLSLSGRVVGYAGELHPRVCTAYGVPARTAYAELDLDALVDAAPDVVEAPVFSTMPVAKEDVAVVVDVAVAAADVQRALAEGAGDLLESIRLFDVYTGDPVPPGRKSLAFALRFRAPDRTLTEADTAPARAAAVARAAELYGAELRS
jgi:phenylalanyl-tRNA synthetase beta chain